jgi:hypothetical protein
MSRLADTLLLDMLGNKNSSKETKVDKILAKVLAKALLEEKKEQKKEEGKKFGFLEQVVLIAIGTYFLGLLQLLTIHAIFK